MLIIDYVDPRTVFFSTLKELCCFTLTERDLGIFFTNILASQFVPPPPIPVWDDVVDPGFSEGPFQAGLPSNSGHYLQTQRRKDRAAAVAKVIAVVRGKER